MKWEKVFLKNKYQQIQNLVCKYADEILIFHTISFLHICLTMNISLKN